MRLLYKEGYTYTLVLRTFRVRSDATPLAVKQNGCGRRPHDVRSRMYRARNSGVGLRLPSADEVMERPPSRFLSRLAFLIQGQAVEKVS